MKILFSIVLFFFAALAFAAAPLEDGLFLASKTEASPEENSQIYIDARNKVINAAAKYEKTPYLYGGVTSRGLDCSGLIYLSFKDALDVSLPRSTSGLYSWAEKISLNEAQPADLLFFKTDNSGDVTHVALYLGGGRFIHSASEGPNTGVIYSTLDEQYWARAYVGAGRAFPEAPSSAYPDNMPARDLERIRAVDTSRHIYLGAAFAPTWNSFLRGGDLFRGFSSHLGLSMNTSLFNSQMIFGVELRPEYDRALGVFRLPVTLSWGFSEKIRIFAGPAFSFGDASLKTENGIRNYSGGTTWLGTIGVTVAPFTFKTSYGNFAPYFEAAWQNYDSNDSLMDLNADVAASLRLSTGIRYIRQVK